jgi:hypothetical protein
MRLGGADTLHVASAIIKQCNEFWTTDNKITGAAVAIQALGMRVCVPARTNLLPDKYKQGDILNDRKVTPIRRTGNAAPGKPA